MSTLAELAAYTGVPVSSRFAPSATLKARAGERLLDREYLDETLLRHGVTGARADALREALDEIEADERLTALSCFLRDRAPQGLMLAQNDEYQTPVPACLTGFAQRAYAFLYALSCVPVGIAELQRRGVPERYYKDIPERMIRARLERYVKTGDIRFTDYPWDMNFYCCAIVFLNRFYFIPCRCDYPNAFVNRADGRVVALWAEGGKVRRDGQLDGVNGVFDDGAFVADYTEDDSAATGYPVHPCGVIMKERVTLKKSEWECALRSGDLTLALHIPGGEGYTPERVRESMLEALAYYAAYFPDLEHRGFWSESWLYDEKLSELIGKDSNIARVQRQLYNYPTMEGEGMSKLEVFGSEDICLDDITPKTRLERGLLEAFRRGEHFHTSGMFVLPKDAARIGEEPYLSRFEL